MSYNILFGGQDRVPAIASVISEHNPDAVALLEASNRDNAERMARDLSMGLVDAFEAGLNIVWLTRLPVVGRTIFDDPSMAHRLLGITVDLNGSHVHLFATHLTPEFSPEAEASRLTEMKGILDALCTTNSSPHALVGDFNTLDPADTIGWPEDPSSVREARAAVEARQFHPRTIPLLHAAGYIDCYRAHHADAAGYTCPAAHPWLRIDYIFASHTLADRVSECNVVQTPEALHASDHLPVCAEFSL